MTDKVEEFYEDLADYYHLIYEDWPRSIARQAATLNSLLASHLGSKPLKILDCSCGIGTQSIGLAQLGHHVVASDLSPAAVHRAENEARQRGLTIQFHVSDMTSLKEIEPNNFDAAIAIDNALPHIDRSQLGQAAAAIRSKLRPNGIFIASIRDYDALIVDKPTSQPPPFGASLPNAESSNRSGIGPTPPTPIPATASISTSPSSHPKAGKPTTSSRAPAGFSETNYPPSCATPDSPTSAG
jgi:glycine/sarcosine N-methyltransferase